MRRLAESLRVGTMTLYGHFSGKQALLDAVVEAAVTDVYIPAAGGDWRAGLRALVLAVRGMLVRHPSLVEIRVRDPVVVPAAFELTERAMAILLEAGFARSDAAACFRLLFVYCFGFAALSPVRSEEQDRASARTALAALPAESYPVLSGTIEEGVAAMGGEEVFAFGLDRILDGLGALQAPAGGAQPVR